MGIDIYLHWQGQTDAEKEAQRQACLTINSGGAGYLREAYHGEPYATSFLCAEAFDAPEGARIPAHLLRERLPEALALVRERQKKLYKATEEEIAEAEQSFRDFVALCERKEQETGEPVLVMASY